MACCSSMKLTASSRLTAKILMAEKRYRFCSSGWKTNRDRLVVILAGYPEPMKDLIASNPGLQSRFNMQMTFADYTPAEMGHIFEAFCTKNHFEIGPDTRARLLLALHWHYQRRDEQFRQRAFLCGNIFENSIRNLANRIAGVAPITKEVLTTFESPDVDVESVPDDFWDDICQDSTRFGVKCPGCETRSEVPAKFLGRKVRCNKCEHRFVAAWGEPDIE